VRGLTRRRRGHLWAGLYAGLFGVPEDDAKTDDADDSEE
jgi:hypothetical protein